MEYRTRSSRLSTGCTINPVATPLLASSSALDRGHTIWVAPASLAASAFRTMSATRLTLPLHGESVGHHDESHQTIRPHGLVHKQ